jgi:hypothetical protein
MFKQGMCKGTKEGMFKQGMCKDYWPRPHQALEVEGEKTW